MKKYLILTSILISIVSASNGLIAYTKDDSKFVKLQSKSDSCIVEYHIFSNLLHSTTCLNFKNSHKEEIFCTKDKSICKKHSEVIFFNITHKDLNKIKISTKIPFYGTRSYNFMGGSGTNERIKINKKGIVFSTFIGIYGESTNKVGSYKTFLKNDFIYDNVICSQENKGSMICAYLYKSN